MPTDQVRGRNWDRIEIERQRPYFVDAKDDDPSGDDLKSNENYAAKNK